MKSSASELGLTRDWFVAVSIAKFETEFKLFLQPSSVRQVEPRAEIVTQFSLSSLSFSLSRRQVRYRGTPRNIYRHIIMSGKTDQFNSALSYAFEISNTLEHFYFNCGNKSYASIKAGLEICGTFLS